MNFDVGSLVTLVTVTVIEDSVLENDEVFFGRLHLIGAERIDLVADETVVTITDNDGKLRYNQ